MLTGCGFRLVTDRETGKPKGYGFCEYADGATALSAMRNLNGYEINGRNLRVDFADGGDKSGGGGGGGGGDKGHHHHSHHGHHQAPSVSGEMAISAIEAAIAKFGPLKLYDMLLDLKEHARQKPEYTKSILGANPALTHAIVQAFKTLQIPIPSSTESQPALLAVRVLPSLRCWLGALLTCISCDRHRRPWEADQCRHSVARFCLSVEFSAWRHPRRRQVSCPRRLWRRRRLRRLVVLGGALGPVPYRRRQRQRLPLLSALLHRWCRRLEESYSLRRGHKGHRRVSWVLLPRGIETLGAETRDWPSAGWNRTLADRRSGSALRTVPRRDSSMPWPSSRAT